MSIQPIIDRLRELHAASTRGEWKADLNQPEGLIIGQVCYVIGQFHTMSDQPHADAEFTVAAHNYLPEVLAELERLREFEWKYKELCK